MLNHRLPSLSQTLSPDTPDFRPTSFPQTEVIFPVEGLSHNDAPPDKLSHDTILVLIEACSMILSWLDACSHSNDGTLQRPMLDIADRVVFPSVFA
jgi:hypothetical protein